VAATGRDQSNPQPALRASVQGRRSKRPMSVREWEEIQEVLPTVIDGLIAVWPTLQ
jgi:hypothetical protein